MSLQQYDGFNDSEISPPKQRKSFIFLIDSSRRSSISPLDIPFSRRRIISHQNNPNKETNDKDELDECSDETYKEILQRFNSQRQRMEESPKKGDKIKCRDSCIILEEEICQVVPCDENNQKSSSCLPVKERVMSTKIYDDHCNYIKETVVVRTNCTQEGLLVKTKHIIEKCSTGGEHGVIKDKMSAATDTGIDTNSKMAWNNGSSFGKKYFVCPSYIANPKNLKHPEQIECNLSQNDPSSYSEDQINDSPETFESTRKNITIGKNRYSVTELRFDSEIPNSSKTNQGSSFATSTIGQRSLRFCQDQVSCQVVQNSCCCSISPLENNCDCCTVPKSCCPSPCCTSLRAELKCSSECKKGTCISSSTFQRCAEPQTKESNLLERTQSSELPSMPLNILARKERFSSQQKNSSKENIKGILKSSGMESFLIEGEHENSIEDTVSDATDTGICTNIKMTTWNNGSSFGKKSFVCPSYEANTKNLKRPEKIEYNQSQNCVSSYSADQSNDSPDTSESTRRNIMIGKNKYSVTELRFDSEIPNSSKTNQSSSPAASTIGRRSLRFCEDKICCQAVENSCCCSISQLENNCDCCTLPKGCCSSPCSSSLRTEPKCSSECEKVSCISSSTFQRCPEPQTKESNLLERTQSSDLPSEPLNILARKERFSSQQKNSSKENIKGILKSSGMESFSLEGEHGNSIQDTVSDATDTGICTNIKMTTWNNGQKCFVCPTYVENTKNLKRPEKIEYNQSQNCVSSYSADQSNDSPDTFESTRRNIMIGKNRYSVIELRFDSEIPNSSKTNQSSSLAASTIGRRSLRFCEDKICCQAVENSCCCSISPLENNCDCCTVPKGCCSSPCSSSLRAEPKCSSECEKFSCISTSTFQSCTESQAKTSNLLEIFQNSEAPSKLLNISTRTEIYSSQQKNSSKRNIKGILKSSAIDPKNDELKCEDETRATGMQRFSNDAMSRKPSNRQRYNDEQLRQDISDISPPDFEDGSELDNETPPIGMKSGASSKSATEDNARQHSRPMRSVMIPQGYASPIQGCSRCCKCGNKPYLIPLSLQYRILSDEEESKNCNDALKMRSEDETPIQRVDKATKSYNGNPIRVIEK